MSGTKYYATTQVSVNAAPKGEPRDIKYLPARKAATESEWKEFLSDDDFKQFVAEGVLVEVKPDETLDSQGFIHFKHLPHGTSVVDSPNAPPDEEVAADVTEEVLETAQSQKDPSFTGSPPGFADDGTATEDDKALGDSTTTVSNDAASPRAEETAAKGGPPAKPATNEAAKKAPAGKSTAEKKES